MSRRPVARWTLGGNLRVGLADTLYPPDESMARSNGELIDDASRIAELTGRTPTTPDETPAALGIGSAKAVAPP